MSVVVELDVSVGLAFKTELVWGTGDVPEHQATENMWSVDGT